MVFIKNFQRYIWTTLVIVVILPCFLFATITFERWYGESSEGHSVQQTTDGGYIVCGVGGVFYPHNAGVYLSKTDSLGNQIWEREYRGSFPYGIDWGYSVKQTNDGGYIIGAVTEVDWGESHIWVLKTDSLGDTLWTRVYGGDVWEWIGEVCQTQDGGYIIAGVTMSYGAGDQDGYLIKTDSLGDTTWTRTYGGSEKDRFYSVQQTSDGGYIMTGYTFGFLPADVYLVKVDSIGTLIWEKNYSPAGHALSMNYAYCVQQTMDGGYIIAGYSLFFPVERDLWLIRTDSAGDTLWTKIYGDAGVNCDEGKSVQQLPDGGFIVAGYTSSFGAGEEDVWLLRTDQHGDTLWTRTFGWYAKDEGYSVQQTEDGGFVILGMTWSQGGTSTYSYLIKTDENGFVGVQEKQTKSSQGYNMLTIKPNPTIDKTNIKYVVSEPGFVSIKIYDETGSLVNILANRTMQPGHYTINWDEKDIRDKKVKSGIYFCRIVSNETTLTRKIVVIR